MPVSVNLPPLDLKDLRRQLRRRGKRKNTSRKAAELEKANRALAGKVEQLGQEIEDLKRRIEDVEYFRDHAKDILEIADVQDS